MAKRLIAALVMLLAAVPALAADSTAYRIGEHDEIRVAVYGEEDLSGNYTVRPDGTIFVPLVQNVEVSGLTTQEAGRRIAELLEDGYLVDPQVSVEVERYRSQRVAVVGAVGQPGEYYLNGPTSLLQILARAGNIDAEKSAREVRVRRSDGTTVVVGLDGLLSTGAGDLPLGDGDVVSVPEGQFVYVAGEVQNPGAIIFWEGLTVTQALTKAGGPSETARLRGAYILRDGEQVPVNLKRILEGREADISLEPGDQLVLRQSPI